MLEFIVRNFLQVKQEPVSESEDEAATVKEVSKKDASNETKTIEANASTSKRNASDKSKKPGAMNLTDESEYEDAENVNYIYLV